MLGSPLRYSSGGGWRALLLAGRECLFWESCARLGRNCDVRRYVRAARGCRGVVTSRSQWLDLGRALSPFATYAARGRGSPGARTVRRALMTSVTCHALSRPSGALAPCSPACPRTALRLVPIRPAVPQTGGGLAPSPPLRRCPLQCRLHVRRPGVDPSRSREPKCLQPPTIGRCPPHDEAQRPRIKGLAPPSAPSLLDGTRWSRSNTRPLSPGGQVAQLVEQRTENPRVGGSIPPLATT